MLIHLYGNLEFPLLRFCCIYLILFLILIYLSGSSLVFSFGFLRIFMGLSWSPYPLLFLLNWLLLCLIFNVFIHPKFHVNRTAGESAILAIRSLRFPGLLSHLLYLTDTFSWPNQPIREPLKKSAKGQSLSIIWLVIFHDSSSNELLVNF